MATAMKGDVDIFRAWMLMNRYVARDISQWVDEDDDILDLVVEDALSGWRPDEAVAARWTRYADAVEYAPPGSLNDYREGFGEGDDLDAYYRAVWRAQITELRARWERPDSQSLTDPVFRAR